MKTLETMAKHGGKTTAAKPGARGIFPGGSVLMKTLTAMFVAALVSVPATGISGQLSLTNSPLYLATPVSPNIFFLLDDSGSMDWEFIYNNGTGLDNGSVSFNIEKIDLTPDNDNERLFMCAGYNLLAYNPSVTYTFWQGQDKDEVIFKDAWLYNGGTDASPNYTVRKDPYDNSRGTKNLTARGGGYAYWLWTDSDGDGQYDAGECGNTSSNAGGVTFASLSDAQKNNFANWYSYYRDRLSNAKYAIGSVIAPRGPEVRMGMATLHNNGGNSNIKIETMNDAIGTNPKKDLLKALHRARSDGGTPLRTKLDEVGKYYECKSGNIFNLSERSSQCPIATNASGGSCQQNFTVLMTDGYWNDSFTGIGNTDTDGSGSYDGGAYADSASNTLADVAMHYYERDLATNLSNLVPAMAGVDNATHQHMVTYTIAFGVAGDLSAGPGSTATSFPWPDPTANNASNATKVDDLRHAAYNGRGQFLSAKTPDEIKSSLTNALASIGERTGSSSSVAANSVVLTASSAIYQARFTSGEWTGDMRAVALLADGSLGGELWSAKTQLSSQSWDTGRIILTRNASQGIPFRWTTSGTNALTTAQQGYLNDDPTTTAVDNDSEGSVRLEYLRGSSANEGVDNNYRPRNGYKLGDIVNSDPILVGAPPYKPETESVLHSSFRTTHSNRRNILYAGGNDGMLHGFDVGTGQEKIAYVPSMVFSSLNKLTNPSYVHQYYVDGTPATGDAYDRFANGCSSVACWRTLVVSGLAAGGKGMFALDVTDPDGTNITNLRFQESNAANIALWELDATATNASSKNYTASNMGYVHGKAVVNRMKSGDWAVIFGNGYNSTSERAVLYIVRARDGYVIREIDLSNGATNTGNGLSAPTVVDIDGDGSADYIYAGDLLGNLWKVNVTSSTTSDWGSAYTSSGVPQPLFSAVDGTTTSTVIQPITSRPSVGRHPAGQGGYMVYFGTGRYLATGDQTPRSSPVHTFYGVWDKDTNTGGTPVTRADLLPQTISTATVGSTTVRSVTNTSIIWRTDSSGTCQPNGSGTCLGWRDDLRTAQSDSTGEMMVTNPLLTGTDTLPAISFTTLIPQSDPCTAGGTGFYMLLNPVNGGPLAQAVIDVTGDGIVDSNDLVDGAVPAGFNPNVGIPSDPISINGRGGVSVVPISGSGGNIVNIRNYFPAGALGRQSWRQLK